MSQIQIGPFKYNVLKRDGNRLLLQWTESTGVEKTRWVILKTLGGQNG